MDAEKQPVARVTVSLHQRTLQEVDEFAHAQHLTRSAATEILLGVAFGLVGG